jgi:hypothetical protein
MYFPVPDGQGVAQARADKGWDMAYGDQARPLPQSLGAGDDPELAARDSEDWLRQQWNRS